jgi:hypothetical protein
MGAFVMRRLNTWIVVGGFCLLLNGLPAWADDVLAPKIAAQINQHDVIQANVVQVRKMQTLKRPLVSQGQLVYSKQDGVFWLMHKPVSIRYWFGEQRVVEVDGVGQRRVQEAKANPRLAQMGQIMKSMLSAKTEALQSMFDVQAKGAVDKWTLVLTPRGEPLSQYMKAVRVSGGRFIEAMVLEEKSGDTTEMTLLESRALPSVPTDVLKVFQAP